MSTRSKTRRMPEHHLKPYRQTQALAFAPLFFQAACSARDMGLLKALAEAHQEGLSPVEAAQAAGVSLYAAHVLLEACLSIDLVEFHRDRYRLTRAGDLWLNNPMTRVNADFVRDVCYRGAAHLGEALKTERPAGLRVFGNWETIYEGLSQLPPDVQRSWFAFDHHYSDQSFPHALPIVFTRRPARLLDVGGNTGKWALLCVGYDAHVEVTVLDHPGQLARLRLDVEAAGQDARIHDVAMDLLDHRQPFPDGFDAVWMSQFLDCFPERDIVELLRRGKDALAPEGRLYVMEPFWDRQPNDVARLCLHGTSIYFACIANGKSRMYRAGELIALIREAGLAVEADQHVGMSHTLLTCVNAG